MRVTHDAEADAAYVYLVERISAGEVAATRVANVKLPAASINLDFDSDGRLLGIEVLGASKILREGTIQACEDITRRA